VSAGVDDTARLEQHDFARVVRLNTAAKELISRSFRVNLLALDAMVQSKRGGSALRGFEEVSSQMRSWSRDLHRELEQLGELSRAAVARASASCKQRRLLRLLGQAATQSANAVAVAAHRQRDDEQKTRDDEMRRAWRRVSDVLSDLNQLGLMAVVLSRSAMIEASSGSSEQRAQLADVCQEFTRNAEIVTTVLKDLTRSMNQDPGR